MSSDNWLGWWIAMLFISISIGVLTDNAAWGALTFGCLMAFGIFMDIVLKKRTNS